jgi:hypothetical protein
VWYVLLAKNAIINHLKKEANDKHKIELIDQVRQRHTLHPWKHARTMF